MGVTTRRMGPEAPAMHRPLDQGDCVYKSFAGKEIKNRSAEKAAKSKERIALNRLADTVCTTQSP